MYTGDSGSAFVVSSTTASAMRPVAPSASSGASMAPASFALAAAPISTSFLYFFLFPVDPLIGPNSGT